MSVGWLAIPLLAVSIAQAKLTGADPPVSFSRDIRPVLSNTCYPCHGPDGAKRKAGLRLDQEASARAERDGRRAIVAGDLEASELYQRITAVDPDERMPPVKSGKSITQAQIERIGRWIAQGAKWETHWAFVAPRRPAVPQVKHPEWLRNPLDAYILERLEREGLVPSPEAKRGVLLRRVSFDLTGLPPTLTELEAFENDRTPAAYERAVDRLLASPRFGERMAIVWLNAARYADTNGYQTDAARMMWRWRDWVIDAFNRNMPFDRFTIEQLGGDLLPGSTLDQKLATGFNRNHRGNGEGGIIAEEYAVEYVADRVDTTATVWLGLTLGCARCHSHKFDPITQEEYYKVFSFFNNVPENGRAVKYGNSPPMIKTPTRRQQEELEKLELSLAELKNQWHQADPLLASAQAAWESSVQARPPFDWLDRDGLVFHSGLDDLAEGCAAEPGLVMREGAPRGAVGAVGDAIRVDGHAYLDAGNIAPFGFYDKFTLSVWINPADARGGTIISRAVDEPEGDGYSVVLKRGKIQVNLVKRWLDDAIRVESTRAVPSGRWTHVAVTYDGSRVAGGVRVYLDGKPAEIAVLLDELNQSFQTKQPLRIGGGLGPKARFVGAIDEPGVYARVLAAEDIEALAVRESVSAILEIPAWRRTAGQARKVRQCFLATDAPEGIQDLRARIKAVFASLDALTEQVPTTMVMQELPVPRASHVLVRGQYDKPGPRVERGVPGCLSPWPAGAKLDRLGLARWLVSPENPLTARVAVNRAWQTLFGTGLVKTIDDFGAQGEPPSHPSLLDWLATELVKSGWDSKKLLRLIVTSATYRQSSRVTPAALRRDPENRLLARGPRLRLTAEMIRDQALGLGGLLVERQGGPSVKPYQPPGLWKELTDDDYVQDHGPSLYRRSLYTFWKRTVPPPAMVAFDAPARETCIVRETRTNTPLQALSLLNDVTFVEAARWFAQRIIARGGVTPDARLEAAFRAATARRPRPHELAILRAALEDALVRFRQDPHAAKALLEVGESPLDPRLDASELAAYTIIAQLILNLDETITKE
jgi:Protein of unknown function (DUF1553)/Protein of unknown function (DUF1549)/Concanavalin A-like lectin/glucanases superfamily/Planctomycete cytochrome C